MLRRSISATDAAPTPTARARRRTSGASASRRAAERVLESRTPGVRGAVGRWWVTGRRRTTLRRPGPAGCSLAGASLAECGGLAHALAQEVELRAAGRPGAAGPQPPGPPGGG